MMPPLADQPATWEVETQASCHLEQGEIEPINRGIEIMVQVPDTGDFERVAVLCFHIVAVEQRAAAENAAGGLFGEGSVEEHGEREHRRQDLRGAGDVGVGLILATKKDVTGQLMA